MSSSRRRFVRERAGRRCEYCHLPDFAAPLSTFHREHVIARQHGGSDQPWNWCWSCHRCNLYKGPNLSARDPVTGKIVPLFNPRQQSWNRHFEWRDVVLAGRTQIGRATIALLNINDPARIELRRTLIDVDEWNPD